MFWTDPENLHSQIATPAKQNEFRAQNAIVLALKSRVQSYSFPAMAFLTSGLSGETAEPK